MKFILQEKTITEKKKKKTNGATVTYTTGDIGYNIKQFNKHMGTDFNNPSTEEAKAEKAAEKAAEQASENQLGSSSAVSTASGNSTTSGEGAASSSGEGSGGMGESLKLTEAKRYVKRYYIRPQDIFCSNKSEILKALIDIGNENCSVYTLKNLIDNDDIHKLTTHDIIYYYDDGILYDKNHVKVMDYDLYIKHEEGRKKFANKPNMKNTDVKNEYDDRLTKATEFEEAFSLTFDTINAFGEVLHEAVEEGICYICGEEIEGYGNNPYPVKENGRCCDACNLKFVIPARLESYGDEDSNEE